MAADYALQLERPRLERAALNVAFFLAAALVAARLTGAADIALAQTFTIIFTAIVIEALPFVLLGALVSAAIEVYVSPTAIDRITRLPSGLQLPAATVAGFAFPVCECGSVPVARRLIHRGIAPGAGIAFMLASPVFNPIVLISTWVAYSPRDLGLQMVLGRSALGLVVALAVGWVLGTEGANELLKARGGDAGTSHEHSQNPRRLPSFLEHLTGDFFFMGKFVILGAAFSGAFQTLLPQSVVAGVARTAIIGTLALMGIAFISSLCSEADAFVAVSFSQFSLGSQLAFLAFGPVLDFKLAFLYSATFRRRFVRRLAFVVAPVVIAGSLIFEVLMQ
jgi:uncharacterized membrane protein YraQ (UPF0718 family)